MKPAATFKLLAEYSQFYVYDPSLNEDPNFDICALFEAVENITEDESRRGWVRIPEAICFFTMGQLWVHRLDIFTLEEYDGHHDSQRVLAFNLPLPGGRFAVYGYEERTIEVASREYVVYLRAFNLGVEVRKNERGTDAEFLKRDDLERYEIVLVPGTISHEGVISGDMVLY